jgi:hypothetical protein
VLVSLDETSYDPGSTAWATTPLAWYHGHDGGRAFYTALGHTQESWSEPAFLEHVTGAIEWAAGASGRHSCSRNSTASPQRTLGSPPDFRHVPVRRHARIAHDARLGGANQHLTRRAAELDSSRPYVIEGSVSARRTGGGPDSFCFNLNVAGAGGLLVARHLGDEPRCVRWPAERRDEAHGFRRRRVSANRFRTRAWAEKGVEYLLRVAVNVALDGTPKPKAVTTTLLESGVERTPFRGRSTRAFPISARGARVRFGVNTHGTDWTLRSLRVHYAD